MADRARIDDVLARIDAVLDDYEAFWSSTRPAAVDASVPASPLLVPVYADPQSHADGAADEYVRLCGDLDKAVAAERTVIDNHGNVRNPDAGHHPDCECTICLWPHRIPIEEGLPWLAAGPAFERRVTTVLRTQVCDFDADAVYDGAEEAYGRVVETVIVRRASNSQQR